VEFYNTAFDVTPARYIAGIITEFGVFTPQDLSTGLKLASQSQLKPEPIQITALVGN
jgi:methylthioribose-1-phosphate isomerase